MKDTLKERMQEVLRLTLAGRLNDATRAIKQALKGPAAASVVDDPAAEVVVLDDCVEVDAASESLVSRVDAPASAAEVPLLRPPFVHDEIDAGAYTDTDADADADADAGVASRGEFSDGSFTHAGQTRRYKFYMPPLTPGDADRGRPLVVMLHGCTQDPDDFAAGTGMNERAREQGFCVLYPAQAQGANPQRCWNWFKHPHQQRDRGEPALIAGMTRALMQEHDIDPDRVYIAGLSAGGAMAAIVGAAYPDIFAAVGVHSGLARGSASDVTGALTVMKSGSDAGRVHARRHAFDSMPTAPIPTIVFHGDEDQTVHPRNGERVIASVLGSEADGPAGAARRVEQGTAAQGRRYTREWHHADDGKVVAEHWLVHGAGHAWSGGDPRGSYTDSAGPDASLEMLRFFFAHPREPQP